MPAGQAVPRAVSRFVRGGRAEGRVEAPRRRPGRSESPPFGVPRYDRADVDGSADRQQHSV